MTPSSTLRYFAAIGLHAPYALVVLVVIVAVAVWALVLDPREIDSGFGMVLFVQMFLASSGFVVRARRGHFDPVMTCESDRTAAAMSHWIVSIAPGAAAWLCVAAAGHALGNQMSLPAVVARVASLFIVSAMAWAGGFALARGAAGVVWMAALLGLLLRRAELLVSPTAPMSVAIFLRHTLTIVFCPFLLVGHPVVTPGVIGLAVILSAVVLLSVVRLAGRLDIYLVDRA